MVRGLHLNMAVTIIDSISIAAIQALLSRIDQDKPAPAGGDASGEIDMELATQLVTAAMECKGNPH